MQNSPKKEFDGFLPNKHEKNNIFFGPAKKNASLSGFDEGWWRDNSCRLWTRDAAVNHLQNPKNNVFLVIQSDPFKGLSDLQLGDEKVTLNHLVVVATLPVFDPTKQVFLNVSNF